MDILIYGFFEYVLSVLSISLITAIRFSFGNYPSPLAHESLWFQDTDTSHPHSPELASLHIPDRSDWFWDRHIGPGTQSGVFAESVQKKKPFKLE